MQLLRSIRGAIGIGGIWAVPWAVAGVLASPFIRAFAHASPPNSIVERLADGALIGWYGFLGGLAFSLVLAFMGRRQLLRKLTLPRMAAWGTMSSILLTAPPMIAMLVGRADGWRPEDPFYLGGSLLLSAGCAVTSLIVARRGAPRGDSIVDFGEEVALRTTNSAESGLGSGSLTNVGGDERSVGRVAAAQPRSI